METIDTTVPLWGIVCLLLVWAWGLITVYFKVKRTEEKLIHQEDALDNIKKEHRMVREDLHAIRLILASIQTAIDTQNQKQK